MSGTSTQSAGNPASTSGRLVSLDALRGFDMFWIIGADALVRALDKMGDNRVTQFLAQQLSHQEWVGFHFYDLIFPLFVFIVGVALVFSLSKTIAQAGKTEAMMRIVRRGALLFLLGIVYSGGLSAEWPNIRLLGVLQRIGLCYLAAGLIFCHCRLREMIAICAALLAGYWLFMTFVSFPDVHLERQSLRILAQQAGTTNATALVAAATNRVSGAYEKGYNLANHFDFQHLPGKKYDTYWDPEGLLSTFPAIATCLLGVFAGLLLKTGRLDGPRKAAHLLIVGAACVALGFLWGQQFPVVKKIWTSSFVLVAGGYSSLLLGAFYLVVDVWKFQAWCRPFVWIGMNSITIYLANNIIGFRKLADRFVGGDVKHFFDAHVAPGSGELVGALAGLGLGILLVYFLYRRKIFLRL